MSPRDPALTRRALLSALGASCVGAACTNDRARPRTEPHAMSNTARRMPVAYVPHGGGPWPWMREPLGDPRALRALADYLRGLPGIAPTRPRAVVMITAHWEAPVVTVGASPRPPMLYDYYGFPPETYQVTWSAPGDPALAARVRALLTAAGIESADDPARGYDHGTFVPMKVAWPEADIPTVQMSLREGLDPAAHLAVGRALAPLRDEGVLLLGSGMSYHNMRGFFQGGSAVASASGAFDEWLGDAVGRDADARAAMLTRWREAPGGRASHPREEHLLPLMVMAGAAGDDRGRVAWRGELMHARLSAVHFG